MTKLQFLAETLTPLVIAGAENKTPNVLAEGLRPPSLRGAMHWWFRAMMGGIVGAHDNYKTLRALEGKIFGATEQGSSIQLRTYLVEGAKDTAYLCMNDRGSKKFGAPKAYDKIQRSSIVPPSTFLIQFRTRGGGNKEIRLALLSLWLTVMLGGIGNRSRRGFGSLTLAPVDEQTKQAVQELSLDFSYPDKSLIEIKSALEAQLQKVRGHFASYAPAVSSPPPAKFSVLSKVQAKLWIIRPKDQFWTSWQRAMIGLRDDIYRPCKQYLGVSAIGSANPRFASPLIVQIKRTVANQYFGVLLAFDHSWYRKQFWSSFSQLGAFLKTLSNYEYEEVTLP
jgi:CRISPR-associated protein Cmr1